MIQKFIDIIENIRYHHKYALTNDRSYGLELLELATYAWKRNKWCIDITRFLSEFDEVEINEPVFVIGTESSGLTLLSRVIRRNRRIVSVVGDSDYWSGPDEMQLVLGPILPWCFTGLKHNRPAFLEKRNINGSWLYATDKLVGHYRVEPKDIDKYERSKFKKIIRWRISKYSNEGGRDVRFLDKSQTFTLKVRLINDILDECNPYFLLVTRNPYAVCYRAAQKKLTSLFQGSSDNEFVEALELASQHWRNSMKYALRDRSCVANFATVKFEEFLRSPEETMRDVCRYLTTNFCSAMLPNEDQNVPFGSKGRGKWYPIDSNPNRKYLAELDERMAAVIEREIHPYGKTLGYENPFN